MLTILFIVLPIFLVIFLGKALQLVGIINSSFIKTANRLIFNVCLPILLFHKISSANIHHVLNVRILLIMAATIVSMFVISFAVAKTPIIPQRSGGSFMMNNFRANYAYLGLPVSYYAFGDPGLLHASILMAFMVPLVNLLSVLSLGLFSGRRSTAAFIKNTLFSPLAIACIAGLAVSYAEIVFPEFITRTLDIISGVTLPLALFCIGASLAIRQIKGNLFVIFLSTGFKLLLMPAVAIVLLWFFEQPVNTLTKVLVVMVASPTATVNFVLAATMGGDTDSTSGTIVISTLLSIFSYVFWLTYLGL